MLEEILAALNNWFEVSKRRDVFTVSDGSIDGIEMLDGQYFRIVGSVFNDGLHQWPTNGLKDESFEGEVWALAVPNAVIDLAEHVEKWNAVEGNQPTDKVSESFGGYSYSRASGDIVTGWRKAFAGELNRFRKV
jgi:hypothetical protein